MARSINESYICRIQNASAGVDILADMPERVSISVSSQYEPLSLSLRDAGQALGQLGNAIGGNIASKFATKQMWRDTGPIEFTVPLIFDAETNSFDDVHRKLVQLQQLVLPVGNGGATLGAVLLPPNPWRDFGAISGQQNRTIVDLGYVFHFDPCLVASVNLVEEMRNDDMGYPIAGQVDVTFRTDYTFDRQDYLKAAGYANERQGGVGFRQDIARNSSTVSNTPGIDRIQGAVNGFGSAVQGTVNGVLRGLGLSGGGNTGDGNGGNR